MKLFVIGFALIVSGFFLVYSLSVITNVKYSRDASILRFAVFFPYSLVNLIVVFQILQFQQEYPAILFACTPMIYAPGAGFYLFFKSVYEKHVLSWKEYVLHFSPVFLACMLFIPIYILDAPEKLLIHHAYTHIGELKDAYAENRELFYFSLYTVVIGFTGRAVSIIYLGKLLYNDFFMSEGHLHQKRDSAALRVITAAMIVGLFSTLMGNVSSRIFLLIGLFILACNFIFMFLFRNRIEAFMLLFDLGSRPLSPSLFRIPDHFPEQDAALKRLFLEERIYRISGITVNDVAERLKMRPHQFSAWINQTYSNNFNDFLNGYRVKEAGELLSRTDEPVLRIALSVGFNSKTTFNRVFKDVTGQTPLQYRKNGILAEKKGPIS